MRGGKFTRVLVCGALAMASVLAYSRFVEPKILIVKETFIDLSDGGSPHKIRAAVFADMHYGIYKNSIPAAKLVQRINKENVDLVFIPGDFVYHLDTEKLDETFSALGELNAPVFAVLGNHDVGRPGPSLERELITTLERLGVRIVENTAVLFEVRDLKLNIAGASDIWKGPPDYDFELPLPGAPVLFLAHNPDTAYDAPRGLNYDLMISGHTHGGQIRLPFLYKQQIPTQYPFDIGLYDISVKGGQRRVFVTSGTGMVGLPFRFLMPPRIDILNLQISEDETLTLLKR